MKIVHTDNFGGDYPDERFVTGLPRLAQVELQEIVDLIHKIVGPDYHRYYKVVEDDYELKPGFEP